MILTLLVAVASEMFHLSVDNVFRVRAEARFAQALQNIRAIISDMDLSEKKSGQGEWGTLRYQWKSEVLREAGSRTNIPDPESTGPPEPGSFMVRLYRVDLTLELLEGARNIRRSFDLVETQFSRVRDG